MFKVLKAMIPFARNPSSTIYNGYAGRFIVEIQLVIALRSILNFASSRSGT
jgi:hypothetical protein